MIFAMLDKLISVIVATDKREHYNIRVRLLHLGKLLFYLFVTVNLQPIIIVDELGQELLSRDIVYLYFLLSYSSDHNLTYSYYGYTCTQTMSARQLTSS